MRKPSARAVQTPEHGFQSFHKAPLISRGNRMGGWGGEYIKQTTRLGLPAWSAALGAHPYPSCLLCHFRILWQVRVPLAHLLSSWVNDLPRVALPCPLPAKPNPPRPQESQVVDVSAFSKLIRKHQGAGSQELKFRVFCGSPLSVVLVSHFPSR